MKTILEAMINLKEKEKLINKINQIVKKCKDNNLLKELKNYTIPIMRDYQLKYNPTGDSRNMPWKYLINEINNSDLNNMDLIDFIDDFIKESNNCLKDNKII